jgi:hypothetical protein
LEDGGQAPNASALSSAKEADRAGAKEVASAVDVVHEPRAAITGPAGAEDQGNNACLMTAPGHVAGARAPGAAPRRLRIKAKRRLSAGISNMTWPLRVGIEDTKHCRNGATYTDKLAADSSKDRPLRKRMRMPAVVPHTRAPTRITSGSSRSACSSSASATQAWDAAGLLKHLTPTQVAAWS